MTSDYDKQKHKLDCFLDMNVMDDLNKLHDTGSWREMKNRPETKDWAINIILDESDSQNPIFVEIETDDGSSINIGTRLTLDDGLTRLRITAPELIAVD